MPPKSKPALPCRTTEPEEVGPTATETGTDHRSAKGHAAAAVGQLTCEHSFVLPRESARRLAMAQALKRAANGS